MTREAGRLPERLGDDRGGWEMTEETMETTEETMETTEETMETTEETMEMAVMTVMANEVTGCTKDDDEDEAR